MNDQELDRLVAATAPMDDSDVAILDLSGTDHELCEAIMSTPVIDTIGGPEPSDPDPSGEPDEIGLHRPPSRRRWPVRIGIAAVTAAAAVAALVVVQPFGADAPGPLGEPDTAWAAELVEVAEAVPRVLVTADGWEVATADDVGTDQGSLIYDSPDETTLDVAWRDLTIPTDPDAEGPAESRVETYEDVLASFESNDSERLDDITVAGHQAAVFVELGPAGEDTSSAYYTVLWQQGDYLVFLLAGPTDEASFRELAASVQQVDVDTWLSAMPETVIASANRAAVVQAMLTDIPVPDDFDTTALEDADGAVGQEYHSIGADVTGQVVCAWVDVWGAARASGDTAGAQAAVDAVGTSRDWDVLHEMDTRYESGWPEVVWEIADSMAADGTMPAGDGPRPLEQEVPNALGCPGATT
jgi:hypothetical protein